MGKETKIGLAVISVLLMVFGVLLFRKMTTTDEPSALAPPTAMAAMTPPSSAGMSDKPSVVLAQKDSAEPGKVARGFWNQDKAADQGAEPAADAARQNFMPDQSAQARDRYAEDEASASADSPVADAAAGSNPFKKAPAPADEVAEASQREPATAEKEPSEIPDQSPPTAVNPLRRASAQEPIDDRKAAPEGRLAVGLEAPEDEAADDRAPVDENSSVEATSEPKLAVVPDREPPQVELREPEAEKRQPAAREIERASSDEGWGPGKDRQPPERTDPPGVTNGRYTVQPNDNLWIISDKVYGTGGYFKALHEHNRKYLPNPDRLVVGSQISVPPPTTLEQNYPALCPKPRKSAVVKSRAMPASTRGRTSNDNVYVVEEGDTLFDIARYELGKASRWAEIYELNREVLGEDFDHLPKGVELNLPPKAQPADSFTRQNDSRLR